MEQRQPAGPPPGIRQRATRYAACHRRPAGFTIPASTSSSKHLLVDHEIGDDPLQLAVLILKLLHPADFRHAHPGEALGDPKAGELSTLEPSSSNGRTSGRGEPDRQRLACARA